MCMHPQVRQDDHGRAGADELLVRRGAPADGAGAISHELPRDPIYLPLTSHGLRLTAQVQGLGPRFKIKLSLQNTGSKHVADLSVALNYNALLYRLKSSVFAVPLLIPGLTHRIDAELECIDENGASDVVRHTSPEAHAHAHAQAPTSDPNPCSSRSPPLVTLVRPSHLAQVRVFVCSAKSLVPVLSAVVNMPASEMLLSSTVS